MESVRKPAVDEFEELLTDDNVRSMQIMQAALGSGVLIFIVIVIAMYFSYAAAEATGRADFVWILTLIHFVLSAVMIVLSFWLYKRRLTAEAVTRSSESDSISAAACLDALRSAIIIRLGLLEGAAFCGLVVCIVAVMNGVMQENAVFWINLFSAFVMLFFVISLFPSRERLIEFYKNDFQF